MHGKGKKHSSEPVQIHCLMLIGLRFTFSKNLSTGHSVWCLNSDFFLINIWGGSYNCRPQFTVEETVTGDDQGRFSQFVS